LSTKKAVASLDRRIPDRDYFPAQRPKTNETERLKAVDEQISLIDHYVKGLNEGRRGLAMIQEDYDAIMEVVQTLPNGTAVDALVNTARVSIENQKKAFDAVDAEIEAFDVIGLKGRQYEESRRHLIASYTSLGIPFDRALEATDEMSTGVLAQSKKTLEERARRERLVKLICQVLFGIGWILSLADKMYLDSPHVAAEAN
jgi:hypothetical protein